LADRLDKLYQRFSRQFVHLSRERSRAAATVVADEIQAELDPELLRFLDHVDPDLVCDGFRETALTALTSSA
jgi:hypothetical protein